MMKYPIGIQTFSKIIQNGYVYVDKTALIHRLVTQGEWYFLSRPRRFGKSLLVSTLESLFHGDKALFKGLAIGASDYDFSSHPVIKLEFTRAEIYDDVTFRAFIVEQTTELAKSHGITLTKKPFERQFDELVTQLHKQSGKKVALLIDEYDKPILNSLETDKYGDVKQSMNAFYSMIKALDQHLRFTFITGVSKFSKVSVFSSMNNLDDISMDEAYATICGYTKQELVQYFDGAVSELSEHTGENKTDTYQKIEHWYNGYTFSQQAQGVYNPFSVLSLFSKKRFDNYWFESATPTFLIKRLQAKQQSLAELENMRLSSAALKASAPEKTSIQALLVHTGYLTIKSWTGTLYELGIPNNEVRDSFYNVIVEHYAYMDEGLRSCFKNVSDECKTRQK